MISSRPSRIVLSFTLASFLTAMLLISGCRTAPEPVVEEPEAVEPVMTPEPVLPPDPFVTDWPGTTWIYRDAPEGTNEFPGYRGFHLGRDGSLLLINMPEATGATWSADENHLILNLKEGSKSPGLPVSGSLRSYITDPPTGTSARVMRLVPDDDPTSRGIVLERGRIKVDIVENHWIPREMEEGGTVPWPMNREIHMMLLPDASGGMGILGFGGENRFRGSVNLGEDAFVTGPLGITRKTGPASNFEFLYVRKIGESDRYVQVDDDLFLYQGTIPKVAFRVRLFD